MAAGAESVRSAPCLCIKHARTFAPSYFPFSLSFKRPTRSVKSGAARGGWFESSDEQVVVRRDRPAIWVGPCFSLIALSHARGVSAAITGRSDTLPPRSRCSYGAMVVIASAASSSNSSSCFLFLATPLLVLFSPSAGGVVKGRKYSQQRISGSRAEENKGCDKSRRAQINTRPTAAGPRNRTA